MVRQQRRNLVLGIILLSALLLAIFGLPQSFFGGTSFTVRGQNVGTFTGDIDVFGFDGTYETGWLGSVTSGQSISVNPITGECFDDNKQRCRSYDVSINGNNDGEIRLSNNFLSNDKLILTSSMNNDGKGFNSLNGISVKVILPPGKINGECFLDNSARHSGDAYSSCLVNNFKIERNSDKINEKFEIILEEETEVEFKVYSRASNRGSSSEVRLTLDFEEIVEEKAEEVVEEEAEEQMVIDEEETTPIIDSIIRPKSDSERINIFFYLIPITFILLIGFIIWQRSRTK